MFTNGDIYTSSIELTKDLQSLNGAQAQRILEDIKHIQAEHSNIILNRYLDTLAEHIVYCLGLNVLECVND